MSILPIIVLYNVDFHETNVYRTLLSHVLGLKILLYENSQKPLNQQYESESVCYYHNPQNGGVSAAYNYGASRARRMGDFDAILLLDEDTQFESDFIMKLQAALTAHPETNLFVPQIFYLGDLPFSPIHREFRLKRGAILQEGIYRLDKYLPVNSGACIRLSAFEKVGGYNPDIRLDFADFDFFSRMAVFFNSLYCVSSTAYQSFSNEEKQVDKLYGRYQLYIEGARVARRNPLIRTMVFVEVLRHTLALTVRTRRIKFILYLIQYFR